jgi:two-component system chemotaxis response regulator CheY
MANILIVDDSSIMRRNLRTILAQGKHTVVGEATNGQEAVVEYEKSKPDLVTMDITMPVMDGIEAVKKIIEKFPEARIVMVSALDQKKMVFEALQNGARHYIVKPITAQKVLNVIDEVLIDDSKAD